MTPMLGNGVYSFKEVATLAGLKPRRVRELFRGRPSRSGRQPVLRGDYEPAEGDQALSFRDLVEAYVAGHLQDHGVPLATLREVHQRLEADLRTPHPFCRQELLTKGEALLLGAIESVGRGKLAEALRDRGFFAQVLLPFLKALEYDRKKLARRWRIADSVVVDPGIRFGAPIIEDTGIPTYILAAAYHANQEDSELVASLYNVKPEHVLAAVRFERELAA
jgi:uncharacterized protein (DUF433 family)